MDNSLVFSVRFGVLNMQFFIKIASLHILDIPTFQTRPEGSTFNNFKQFGVFAAPYVFISQTVCLDRSVNYKNRPD